MEVVKGGRSVSPEPEEDPAVSWRSAINQFSERLVAVSRTRLGINYLAGGACIPGAPARQCPCVFETTSQTTLPSAPEVSHIVATLLHRR